MGIVKNNQGGINTAIRMNEETRQILKEIKKSLGYSFAKTINNAIAFYYSDLKNIIEKRKQIDEEIQEIQNQLMKAIQKKEEMKHGPRK